MNSSAAAESGPFEDAGHILGLTQQLRSQPSPNCAKRFCQRAVAPHANGPARQTNQQRGDYSLTPCFTRLKTCLLQRWSAGLSLSDVPCNPNGTTLFTDALTF